MSLAKGRVQNRGVCKTVALAEYRYFANSFHSAELTFAHVSISCDGAPLSGLLTRAPRRQANQAHAVLQLCNGEIASGREGGDAVALHISYACSCSGSAATAPRSI